MASGITYRFLVEQENPKYQETQPPVVTTNNSLLPRLRLVINIVGGRGYLELRGKYGPPFSFRWHEPLHPTTVNETVSAILPLIPNTLHAAF